MPRTLLVLIGWKTRHSSRRPVLLPMRRAPDSGRYSSVLARWSPLAVPYLIVPNRLPNQRHWAWPKLPAALVSVMASGLPALILALQTIGRASWRERVCQYG